MLQLTAAASSHPGKQRELNEDRVWTQILSTSEHDPLGLFMVCDGIGGHLSGECASHWAVEAIKRDLADLFTPKDPLATQKLSVEAVNAALSGSRHTRTLDETEIDKRVRKAVEKANSVVLGYARQKSKEAGDAGTTLTLAFVEGNQAIIANVGDSRTYLLRAHVLQQITQDHSLVASLVASGQIKPQEVYAHPQRNVIYRSLGEKKKLQVDSFSETLEPGDVLLLCSDGLWEMVREPKEIVKLIEKTPDLREAALRLIEAANAAGGEDNISVVLVKVS